MRSLLECRRRPHESTVSCFTEFRQQTKKIWFFKVCNGLKVLKQLKIYQSRYLSFWFETRVGNFAKSVKLEDDRPSQRRRARRELRAHGGVGQLGGPWCSWRRPKTLDFELADLADGWMRRGETRSDLKRREGAFERGWWRSLAWMVAAEMGGGSFEPLPPYIASAGRVFFFI